MQIERWAAFTTDPRGGNPAGVVRDAAALDESAMQRIAAGLGYSETAFLTGRDRDGARRIRYFTPVGEIPFCGHATLATALAIATAEGPGSVAFATRSAGSRSSPAATIGGFWRPSPACRHGPPSCAPAC